MIKQCAYCNSDYNIKPSHADKSSYCSRSCMASAYQHRMTGQNNPNHRNAGIHVCAVCGRSFHSYNKTRKYCSMRCRNLHPDNLARTKTMRKVATITVRTCPGCFKAFSAPMSDKRVFCEKSCAKENQRMRCRRDENHQEIVTMLRQVGASVIDTADRGRGFPDLIAGFRGKVYLLEVKNPNSTYGRKGLNKNQQKWAEEWRGAPPIVVRSADEALRAIGAIS